MRQAAAFGRHHAHPLHARSLGLEPRTQPWEVDVLDEWLEQLRRPEFAQHVHTDHTTVAQVADIISRSAGLTVKPSTDGPMRAWLHRYTTTARHIRWERPGAHRQADRAGRSSG
jgi:hypothetical protein